MELDLDRGTLTVYREGESLHGFPNDRSLFRPGVRVKLGVLAEGLTPPLCWMAEVADDEGVAVAMAALSSEMKPSRLDAWKAHLPDNSW